MMFFRAVEIQFLLFFLILFILSTKSESNNNISISMKAEINVNGEKTTFEIKPLPSSYAELGEGPHWDIETQSLYYVDILNGKFLRYDYNENKIFNCKIENENYVSFIIPILNATNKFAVGIKQRVGLINWDGISEKCEIEKILYQVENDNNENENKYKGNVFNDGKCDPLGRLFAGTMYYIQDLFKYRNGNLFRFDKKPSIIKNDIGISNGLAWDLKMKKFYYIDTADYNVKSYDYHPETGIVKNPKVIFDFRNNFNYLLPDGMTIDEEGNLYVATFNGSSVFKIDPRTGRSDFQIKLPTEQITSVAFGGPNLDELFVTTSSKNGKLPPAGTTYKVSGLKVKGLPMSKMKI